MALKRMIITSAARQTADRIADDILAYDGVEAEWLLGSEDDLMQELGVGRPTIRQAARLLEQERLLVIKRGPHGGFFGRRPSGEGVTATASVFLQSERSTFRQLLETELVLGPVCAARAAHNPADQERARLLDFYADAADEQGEIPVRRFMELTPLFQREVARLSASPVLFLFVSVLMDLAGTSGAIARVYEDPERRRTTLERHRRVAVAIAGGDAVSAARLMTRHLESIMGWVDAGTLDHPLETRRR